MASIYAVVLETIRKNPGLTPSQIAAKAGPGGTGQVAVDQVIEMLKDDGRVIQTGETYSTATFAVSTSEE